MNASHGLCLLPGNGEHVCLNRWCCGSPNEGIWMNGGAWTGAYYSGSGWVR